MNSLVDDVRVDLLCNEFGFGLDFARIAVSVFEHIGAAIEMRESLADQVVLLEKRGRCSGVRSGSHVVHAVGTDCPLHGTRDDGKRVRVYVRVNCVARYDDEIRSWAEWKSAVEEHAAQCAVVQMMRLRLGNVTLRVD